MEKIHNIIRQIRSLDEREKAILFKMLSINSQQQIYTRSAPQAIGLGTFRRPKCQYCGK